MVAPDFLLSRRQLRRSRLQDALGLLREGVNVGRHRDRLLEQLARAADEPVLEFDSLPPSTVDLVVSLALADVEEKAADALGVVLLCVRVLAADGQFARLNVLAERLSTLSRRLVIERPYLATATEALALVLRSRERPAQRLLEERLGITGDRAVQAVARSREQLDDLLIAATLRTVLANDEATFAERARQAALERQDGLLLAYVEAVLSWHGAASSARPSGVLPAADETFRLPVLTNYLEQRGIHVLYPAQIMAIQGGATLDQDRVVSLPTSSGKTLVAEFRIAAALTRHPYTRALYVAPYRLLARQVARSFRQGLSTLGFTVRDLGSGFDPSFEPDMPGGLPDVSICTPERLDALLRVAATENAAGAQANDLFVSTQVLVFDELQLVGRPGRGPRFELVLTRLRAKYPGMCFLGLSAAGQGADDVARWLTGEIAIAGASRPTGTLEIVWESDGALKQRVDPRPTTVAEIPRTRPLDDAAKLILRLNARYMPVLAIEPSRPLAESLAKRLVDLTPSAGAEWRDGLTAPQVESLQTAIEEVKALLGEDHPLARYMENGIAFHHAGVPTHVLQQVERLAAARLLRVVCATTTVAEGADLPFRVVVIPHLNFPGSSGRLDRELYLNIIGRAGRANVSVEGLVFLLNSNARTLRQVIRTSLWGTTTADRVRGRLGEVGITSRNIEEWTAYNDAQSQIMGWLGDGDSYVEDQALNFVAKTLSWQQASGPERVGIKSLVTDALDDLETRGYAHAASPYRLTARGRSARLTGLSAPTVSRLERAVGRGRDGWLLDLIGVRLLSPAMAEQLARLVLEGMEVVEESLWLRRGASTESAKFEALAKLAAGEDREFYASAEYEIDVKLLTAWILGKSYRDIARMAPVYARANSLFGGTHEPKRTSDATEYIGRLTYPTSWVWTGARVLAGELNEALPSFVRDALAAGLPSQAATQLVALGSVTRPAAFAVTAMTGHDWPAVVDWLASDIQDDLQVMGLTSLDQERMLSLAERIT